MDNTLDIILAGVLAEPEDLPPDRELVTFVNKVGELQFSLKIISDAPESFSISKPITCYANKFYDFDFKDNYFEDWPVRARAFEFFLQDKLVLFRPIQQYRKGEVLYSAEPVMVLPKPPGIGRNSRLIPMLYLQSKDEDDYERLLLSRQPIGPFRYFPLNMPKNDPIYVYVNGNLYGNLNDRPERYNKFVFEFDQLKRVSCDLLEWENIITFREVAFVDSYVYIEDFRLLLESEGEVVSNKDSIITKEAKPFSKGSINGSGDIVKDSVDIINNVEDNSTDPGLDRVLKALDKQPETGTGEGSEEAMFIERLQKHCRGAGLLYDEEDLLNFHTALKVGGLLILAGMSGTGKSRLVRLYAEVLGLNREDQKGCFKFIPVRPTWTDDTDLIGFLDTANNIYRPSDSGLLNLLLDAEKHPESIYLVCFDEMNLARVEHYFSQFLSILELPVEERVLQLYNGEIKDHVYNAYQYPPKIKIGRNVLFVGTVNMDESTYTFSDKVLDRANVLRLKVLPFTILTEELNIDYTAGIAEVVTADEFLRWLNTGGKGLSLNTSEVEFLYKLHKAFNQVDASKGIGYRRLRQIDNYLGNIPRNNKGVPMINRSKALDYQLVQRVLPMIRGPQEQLLKLVGRYDDMTDDIEDSEIIKLMDEYDNISDFTISRTEIKQKAKELRWFGYAS